MQRILFVACLLLSLMVCLIPPAWAGGLDDAKAGLAAAGVDDDKAIRLFTKAIESGELSRDDLIKVYFNRGLAWQNGKGEDDKAIVDFNKVIELNPRHARAYYNRGCIWSVKGDYAKAIADYSKAIELDPKDASAYNILASLMATCPDGRYRDGKRAVTLAEKALKLEESPVTLNVLAAAYAEAGRFQEAIKTQERAITKYKQVGLKTYLPEYEQRLSSYKAGKPWREK